MAHMTVEQAIALALQHHQCGRLREAEHLYRQILAQQPDHFEALHNMGVLAHQVGRNDAAIDFLLRTVRIRPGDAQALGNLGNAYRGAGRLDDAIAAYHRAIALRPAMAEAQYNLAGALFENKFPVEAAAAYRKAIERRPDFAEAHGNLGSVLCAQGDFDGAISALSRSIAIKPSAQAHTNLGSALQRTGRPLEAIESHRQAIALAPGFAEAHNHLGTALNDAGRHAQAIAAFETAIALKLDFPQAHYNLSLALLAVGDFHQGWEEYEWRWKCDDFSTLPAQLKQPRWDGAALEGRTLLLYCEQGFGDTIQFVRYLPRLIDRGGKIIVQCQPELQRLLHRVDGLVADRCQIIARGSELPAFDVWSPVLSIPRALGAALESIPAPASYLSAEPDLLKRWHRRLGLDHRRLNVALAWAGSPEFKTDLTRSITLDRLAALAKIADVTFHSVQKGPAAAQAHDPPAGLQLIDLSPQLHDFADTSAVLSLMDLVITTDTSVAHLAGALGAPVWVMLQFTPDWRWLLERKDSPWYPSMQLFRQPALGDWESVVELVGKALAGFIKRRGGLGDSDHGPCPIGSC